MKVKILRATGFKGKVYKQDDVADVEKQVADRWIKEAIAKKVESKNVAKQAEQKLNSKPKKDFKKNN